MCRPNPPRSNRPDEEIGAVAFTPAGHSNDNQKGVTPFASQTNPGNRQPYAHAEGDSPHKIRRATKPIDLQVVSRLEFASGAVAMRYEPKR